ncbi:hypothetical protein WJX73_001564 [Symbiochloris irregularis]|uniref:Uncharacterized protein n=1 Tax=Symbiochloris irregularis TaxID=706552 RepID=A0AAW1NLS3_9CHLO
MLTQRGSALRLHAPACAVQIAKRPLRAQRFAVSVRSAASDATAEAPAAAPETSTGPKAKLFKLLGSVADPIPAEELWSQAQAEGLKSKHFMKSMLNDLRKRGQVTTKPARGKSYGYILPEKWLALRKQVEKGDKIVEQATAKPAGLQSTDAPVGLKSRQGKS